MGENRSIRALTSTLGCLGACLVLLIGWSGADGGVRPAAAEERGSARGVVKIGWPTVIDGPGMLSIEAIGQTLMKRRGQLETCYASILRRDRSRQGKVTVSMHIQGDGQLVGLSLFDNQAGDEVGACLHQHLKTLRFPRPTGGHLVVACPFEFISR